MNYLDIVLMGYKTTSDFPQYIYREYKKAIDKDYSLKEFFDGCNNAVAYMAGLIDEQVNRHLEMCFKLIEVIENDSKRSDEQKAIDIERVNTDIKLIDKNNFGTPLLSLSKNRLTGHLYYYDVVNMMQGLLDALELASRGNEKKSLQLPNNVSIDFKEIYKQEVTEERKVKLYADLDKIEGVSAKIAFLENEKLTYLQNIQPSALEASGILSVNGFGNGGPLYFDRFIELEIEKLKRMARGPVMQIESLIKPELIDNRLIEVENKLKDKIENWREGFDKIGCAAFCEMLYEKGYFLKGITKRKGPIQFALIRYGLDIEVQMESAKKFSRDRLKPMLKRYFS